MSWFVDWNTLKLFFIIIFRSCFIKIALSKNLYFVFVSTEMHVFFKYFASVQKIIKFHEIWKLIVLIIGYPYVVGKKNQQKQNEMLHQEILKNRIICIILIMFIALTVTSLLLYQLFKYFNHEKKDEIKVDLEGVTVPLSDSQETVSTAVSHR